MQPEAGELPELRPELRLLQGSSAPSGEPTWLIHDPVQNKFIQIDLAAYVILSMWTPGAQATETVSKVRAQTDIDVEDEDVERIAKFIHQNKLVVEPHGGGWRRFANEKEASRKSAVSWLVHNYLFFRVPLVRPQPFLERTLWIADRLTTRASSFAIVAAGVLGVYLTLRQWEVFTSTIPELLNIEGAIIMALALVGIKAAHELGHAYTAVRYGCRVHTMGVAFMVMLPLLYTDVTDAWRLSERWKRFRIHVAGIRVEASIAAVAILVWAILPDGPMRSLAFTLCAVSLISSLLINLNPLMRFDGYHLLSDVVGIDNLQDRSFELGTWKLRELLFAPGDPCPEHLSPKRLRFLIGYAWVTWIYRLILFIGIALMVYHLFFKALGVILFLVEMIVFILRPIGNEIGTWWKMRARILSTRRTWITGSIFASVVLIFVLPWSTQVSVPSVLEISAAQPVFAKRSAIVDAVHVTVGQEVKAGDPILTLRSPDIEQQLQWAKTKLRLVRVKHARRSVVGADKEDSLILEDQIGALESEIRGLEAELTELVLRAPFKGKLLEFNPEVHPGRWIGNRVMIGLIGDPSHHMAKGYIAEKDLWRIDNGARGTFVPESAQRATADVLVGSISVASARYLDVPEVSSHHLGAIAASIDEKDRLVPNSAQYLVQMSVERAVQEGLELSIRGTVLIEGRRESLLARTWQHVLSVFIREAGA